MEQRVHNVPNIGQRDSHPAHNVPVPVPEHEESLEQDHTRAGVQRAQAVYGNESEAVRRVHAAVQARETEVSVFNIYVSFYYFDALLPGWGCRETL